MAVARRALLAIPTAGLSLLAARRFAAASPPPTVLITGADEDVGLRFVRDYATRSWRVIAAARRPDTAVDLQHLAARHDTIRIETLDVTDEAAIQALATKYADRPIDVLINAAGFSQRSGDLADAQHGDLGHRAPDDYLRLHAMGPVKVTEAFYGNLLRGTHKQIVALISAASGYWRTLSDAALQAAMTEIAADAKKDGVSVALLRA